MSEPLDVLRKVFGYDAFRGAQATIIDHVLAGGDALVLMPTGAGKSLCYQIPSIVRRGTGIVVSPLIALMQDQVDALRQLGVRAAFLNSSLDNETLSAVLCSARRGELDLLYVAPERLVMESFLAHLAQIQNDHGLALFAIDEAHCVSQWGHDFRPEYIQLSILHERFPEVPRIGLTATADAITRAEIRTRLAPLPPLPPGSATSWRSGAGVGAQGWGKSGARRAPQPPLRVRSGRPTTRDAWRSEPTKNVSGKQRSSGCQPSSEGLGGSEALDRELRHPCLCSRPAPARVELRCS